MFPFDTRLNQYYIRPLQINTHQLLWDVIVHPWPNVKWINEELEKLEHEWTIIGCN